MAHLCGLSSPETHGRVKHNLLTLSFPSACHNYSVFDKLLAFCLQEAVCVRSFLKSSFSRIGGREAQHFWSDLPFLEGFLRRKQHKI